jgi:hypothetical protein
MAHYTRQTLAAYGFFDDARRTQKHTEDALIPFVLPAIAGRTGELFSAEKLAKELEPMFGPDLVTHLADSLTEPLARAGYLRRDIGGPEGSLYVYADRAGEIPLTATVSRAEDDLRVITTALSAFIRETPTLKPIAKSDVEVADDFIDWITTSDAPSLPGTGREAEAVTHGAGNAHAAGPQIETQLQLLFSSFVSWASRERKDLFEKIKVFTELGLVIDLVSEIRVPTVTKKGVDLTVVLDSTVLLELLGLCGPMLQASSRRLLELCKEHKVGLYTLTHLVDEVNEICHGVLNNPTDGFTGSVNDAVRRYPAVFDVVRRVNKSPDTAVKSLGIRIVPYTITPDAHAVRLFDEEDIRVFSGFLGYDQSKPMMARRDAWSLAYAVRRQNTRHTSNLYESRCTIVTRSPVFARKARDYLTREQGLYPTYAVTPVIELRHFSTMFLLAFGSAAADKVIRAELVASCDRVVRASPGLLRKVRATLERVSAYTPEQLDRIMEDPTAMAEFALATGNDPAVVTPEKGDALLQVIRATAVKDERLRFQAEEQVREERHLLALEETRAATREAQAAADRAAEDARGAAEDARRHAAQADNIARELDRQADLNAQMIAANILREVRLYWVAVLILGVLAGAGLILDMFKEYTDLSTFGRVALLVPVALFVFYHSLAFVWEEIEPAVVRRWVTRKVAERQLARLGDADLQARVWKKLPKRRG